MLARSRINLLRVNTTKKLSSCANADYGALSQYLSFQVLNLMHFN